MAKLKRTDPYSGFFDHDPSGPPSVTAIDAGEAPQQSMTHGGVDGNPKPSSTVRLNADIDAELHRRLRMRVAADGVTIADFLRRVLERELG